MSKYIEVLIKMLEENNGILTAKMARDAKIPQEYFSIMIEKGLIKKTGRGLYSSKTTYVDEMFELQATNPNVIFSHLSALYVHDLTDRTPLKMTITVPRTQNASRLIASGMVEVKRSNEQTHLLGVSEARSPAGFIIRVYNKERTICDIVKNSKNTDQQILTNALKRYALQKDKDLSKLMQYAKVLKTEKKVRQYLEVLL
ncbi:MAG: type IV toxin-antitoxin system AbiEi family antitoxin domain-containing protein [Candidatus Humimicrobiaceae bacterium]